MTARTPGVDRCECGQRVLYAVPPFGGEPVPVDPDENGPLVAWEDNAGVARFRRAAAGEQLALGEYFFRFHDSRCPAKAPVVAITAAPSLRPRCQPVTGGRRASVR